MALTGLALDISGWLPLGSKQASKQTNKQTSKQTSEKPAAKQPSNQVTMVWLALAVAGYGSGLL
jgi:hypothetical protein